MKVDFNVFMVCVIFVLFIFDFVKEGKGESERKSENGEEGRKIRGCVD